MNKFNLFRTRMGNEQKCKLKWETSFITEGAAPINIHILRLDKDRDATMVFTDTEGPDSAIIFTPKQHRNINNLLKSDYYTWEDKMFFVYEDILISREVSYIKQKAYQCNVKVQVLDEGDEEYGGYFISSLRSYVDTELQQKINIVDKERPILILPNQEWIEIGTRISIGGKPWKIIDFDTITNDCIAYISLERDFYFKSDDIIQEYVDNTLNAGIEYVFETTDGYFNSSSPLNIKNRVSKSVTFEIPHGISSIEIETKINGSVVRKQYKVVS